MKEGVGLLLSSESSEDELDVLLRDSPNELPDPLSLAVELGSFNAFIASIMALASANCCSSFATSLRLMEAPLVPNSAETPSSLFPSPLSLFLAELLVSPGGASMSAMATAAAPIKV